MRMASKVTVVIVLAAVLIIGRSEPAFAYCPGLPVQTGWTFAGGYQGSGDLHGVKGYVQGRNVDPVVNGSAAWYMLQNLNIFGIENWAQSGWARRPSFGTYYVFAAWTDPSYGYVEQFKWVTPTFSHNYQVLHLTGPGAYEFSYDTTPWLTTLPNQGWSPTEVQVFSETQNRGDHFPGSIGYEALFWGGQKQVGGSWSDLSLSYQINSLWGSEVAGLLIRGSNTFDTWDKRCTDAS